MPVDTESDAFKAWQQFERSMGRPDTVEEYERQVAQNAADADAHKDDPGAKGKTGFAQGPAENQMGHWTDGVLDGVTAIGPNSDGTAADGANWGVQWPDITDQQKQNAAGGAKPTDSKQSRLDNLIHAAMQYASK